MKFGLIGHPIAHSLSPALFKSAYDGRYSYELIEGEDFEVSYQSFLDGYDGINVTAPFKGLAYAKADIISEACNLTRATNLLIKTNEGIKAYNSDFLGVQMWLTEVLDIPSHAILSSDDAPICLIAGCGGAGKAAAAAAAVLGLKCVLLNRHKEKADELAVHLRNHGYSVETAPLCLFREYFLKADIIIYNIPVAIEEISLLTEKDFISERKKHILEANYNSPAFDKQMINRIKSVSPLTEYTGGKKWLLYQAMTGYEIFTREKPDLRKMSAVL